MERVKDETICNHHWQTNNTKVRQSSKSYNIRLQQVPHTRQENNENSHFTWRSKLKAGMSYKISYKDTYMWV